MDKDGEPESIEDVLDCVEEAGDGEKRVAVSDIVARIGDEAFPPLMLVPALVIVSPLSIIFGAATFCAAIIALIAFQMAIGRQRLWLPAFILDRTLSHRKLDRAVHWLSRPAHAVDKLTRNRLSVLVEAPLDRVWAALCLLLSLVIPFFELVPMSATIIASAIALFALAMLAKDGILALLGLAILGGACWLMWGVATASAGG